jgi:NTE family protein
MAQLISANITAENPDDPEIWLFFSGGGTRAAALSYGVLKELARTPVPQQGPKRMLDDVAVISAVSGGSFTAAYYCLYHDRIFTDFEKTVLKRNMQGDLIWRFVTPPAWWKLLSPYYGRSDVAAEYYDGHIFNKATFGDLAKSGGRPILVINATDMAVGEQFPFLQSRFDLIASDLSSFPISRAVAASTAYPLIFTPVTLRNYAGKMGSIKPDYLKGPESESLTHREREVRNIELSYINSKDPYIHLVDGGLSDNLALQSVEDGIMLQGGLGNAQSLIRKTASRKLVIIVVDAAVHRGAEWSKLEYIPGLISAWWELSDQLGERSDYQSLELLRETLQRWRKDGGKGAADCHNRDYYLITVDLGSISPPVEREFFDNLPTNFHLPAETVDRLINAGGVLLHHSKEYERLLHDLGPNSPKTTPAKPQD